MAEESMYPTWGSLAGMLQLPTEGSAPARALRLLQVLWERQNLFRMFLSPGALRDSSGCAVGVMQGLLFIAFLCLSLQGRISTQTNT